MRRSMPTAEVHFTRLEIARSLAAQGQSVPEIVTQLEERKLLSPTQSRPAKYRIVQRLLQKVQRENVARYRVTKEEAENGLVAYLARQNYLLQRAIADHQWEIARGLSKDIARAEGIETERPVRTEEPSLLAVMLGMKARAQNERPPLPTPTRAIDVTPDKKSS